MTVKIFYSLSRYIPGAATIQTVNLRMSWMLWQPRFRRGELRAFLAGFLLWVQETWLAI